MLDILKDKENHQTIAYTFGENSEKFSKQSAQERLKVVNTLLQSTRTLIVIDNLESATTYDTLAADLVLLAGTRSRILVTSRARLEQYAEVYNVQLGGFEESDSESFLRFEITSRNLQESIDITGEALRSIHDVTGGAPLAMKLVVSQLINDPLDVVLSGIRKARTKSSEVLYAFLYRRIWKVLSPSARKILLAMPAIPGAADPSMISAVSTVEGDDLMVALRELSHHCLLDITHQTSTRRNYTMHALTRHFLCAELPQRWT